MNQKTDPSLGTTGNTVVNGEIEPLADLDGQDSPASSISLLQKSSTSAKGKSRLLAKMRSRSKIGMHMRAKTHMKAKAHMRSKVHMKAKSKTHMKIKSHMKTKAKSHLKSKSHMKRPIAINSYICEAVSFPCASNNLQVESFDQIAKKVHLVEQVVASVCGDVL